MPTKRSRKPLRPRRPSHVKRSKAISRPIRLKAMRRPAKAQPRRRTAVKWWMTALTAVSVVAWLADGPEPITQFRDTDSAAWYAARVYEGIAILLAIVVTVMVTLACLAGRLGAAPWTAVVLCALSPAVAEHAWWAMNDMGVVMFWSAAMVAPLVLPIKSIPGAMTTGAPPADARCCNSLYPSLPPPKRNTMG